MYTKTIIVKLLARNSESAFRKLAIVCETHGWMNPSVFALFRSHDRWSFTFDVAATKSDHATITEMEID